jgi:D-alanyl-D-alanine carboxypeptidase (penicillin-binding protein 5/6)
MALSALLGIAFAALVKPGLPYDEPSHWLNVLYFASHHRIPTIGDPSVSYEAQQPPLAYVVFALVEGPVRVVTSLKGGFYAARIVGGVEWLVALVFAWRVLGRLVPASSVGRPVAFAFLALNPMLLAMAWSVQNDSLALLLGFAAIDYASTVGRRSIDGLHGAVLGAIVAAGVLTKLTDWALVVAIPIWLVLVPRARRPWRAVLAFGGSLAVLSGWWFIRNMVLYGDPLGRGKAAAESGGFGPYPLSGLHSLAHVAENVITYLWLPTEYWRNVVHASGAVKGLVLVMSLVILVVGLIAHVNSVERRHGADPMPGFDDNGRWSEAWSLVIVTGTIAFVAWVFLYFGWSALAPRLAYLALPLWAGLVGLAARAVGTTVPRIRPVLPMSAVVVMLLLCAWSLHAIHSTDTPWLFIKHLS